VVSSAGTLGGFSGGLELKKKLLELESIHHRDTETRRKRRRIRSSSVTSVTPWLNPGLKEEVE
jgi:hypothetical protein